MRQVTLTIDGHLVTAPSGTTVISALQSTGRLASRRSLSGELRAPLCGMGICFECRLTVDGRAHQRGCKVLVREGMWIETATGPVDVNRDA